MVRSRRGRVPGRLLRPLGPVAVGVVLLPCALVWIQLLVLAIAYARVSPGAVPLGWTVTAAGAAAGAAVTLAATALTVLALRRSNESDSTATLLGLAPVSIALLAQVASGLAAPDTLPAAVAAHALAVAFGGAAGLLLGRRARTGAPAGRLVPLTHPSSRLLISEDP